MSTQLEQPDNMKTVSLIAFALMMTLSQGFAADPVNKECPIKGKAVDGSKAASVEVSFCCKKCKAAFDKDPIAGLVKFAKAKDGKCPVSGKDVDTAVKSTVSVAVCCNGCKGKLAKNPKKHLAGLKK